MKKLRYKEIKYLAQSYKASKWWARIWTKMSWLLWGLVYAIPWEPEWNWSRLGVLPLVVLLSTFLVFSFSRSCSSSPFSFHPSPSTSLCFSISVPPPCVYSILFWPLTIVLFLYCSVSPFSTQQILLTPSFCFRTPSAWTWPVVAIPTSHCSLYHWDFLSSESQWTKSNWVTPLGAPRSHRLQLCVES